MKIAVAADGGQVTQHFGHCEQFHIYTGEKGAIVSEETVQNPGHKPGFLPNFLGDLGVRVIISGGMGGGAVEIFNSRDIEVVVGASGSARQAAEAWLRGELSSTGAVCHQHSGGGEND